ncbi:4Fe-4S double cluster binding domain-containing protein [Candidatus Bipolaricaulota bacterium]
MSQRPLQRTTLEEHDIVYNYATISIEHVDELGAFMDQLAEQGKLSDHETFQEYVQHARLALPEDFAAAKSIIVFALYTKLMKADFTYNGIAHEILIPPQYYGLGLPQDAVSTIVRTEIVSSDEWRVERLPHGHLKLLAVRSGLARYGRNNISYVEGMGSFITLAAFVTDQELPDEWTDIGMMAACQTCTICFDNCPTGAIRQDEFVIDAGKCIPLYNEIPGDFPEWLPADVHNSYIGCMRCQLPCPGNRDAVQDAGRLPDITEEETQAILAGLPDNAALESAGERLRIGLTDEDTLKVVSRNVRALLVGG